MSYKATAFARALRRSAMKKVYKIKNPKENISAVTSICERFPQKITLTNGKDYAVNAKSIIGSAYAAAEWECVRMETEEEIPELESQLKQKGVI